MTSRNSNVEEIVKALTQGQSLSFNMDSLRADSEGLSDETFVQVLLKSVLTDPGCKLKILMGHIEDLLVKKTNEKQVRLVEQSILEKMSEMIDDRVISPFAVIPYLGRLSREVFELYESWHSPRPQAPEYPPLESEVRSAELEEIIKVLIDGQMVLNPERLSELREESYQMPDAIFIYSLMREITHQPEQVNWKILLEGIEGLLDQNPEEPTYLQHTIVESFSNSAANKQFDYKWLAPHIGPRSRKIIDEIDAFYEQKSPAELFKRWVYLV